MLNPFLSKKSLSKSISIFWNSQMKQKSSTLEIIQHLMFGERTVMRIMLRTPRTPCPEWSTVVGASYDMIVFQGPFIIIKGTMNGAKNLNLERGTFQQTFQQDKDQNPQPCMSLSVSWLESQWICVDFTIASPSEWSVLPEGRDWRWFWRKGKDKI